MATELKPSAQVVRARHSMRILHNQTNPQWVNNRNPDDLGTGLFIYLDEQSEEAEAMTKAVMENITYTQCIGECASALAFKWIPHDVADLQEIKSKSASCSGACVYTCPHYCCLCVDYQCIDVC